MKSLALLTLAAVMFSCHKRSEQATFKKFEIEKGTNVAHWLSQSQRRGLERDEFFTKSDVEQIANLGFDHIRLPIDEEQMWDEDGTRHEEALLLMQNCIKWCAEYELRVIVDLHILRSHHFNAEKKPLWTDKEEQEKFFDLWRDLSKTLHEFPNGLVAYELMNEAVADDPELWNDLIAKAFAAIRELEPERTIVIGSNRWQSANTFDQLKVPANDPNILLSFHFYEPFLLTHYGAEWTELGDYNGPVHYPGTILNENEFESLPDGVKPIVKKWVNTKFDKASILDMWKKPIEKSKALGLPLYCGEFGVMNKAPEKDRLNWYRDLITLFEENNIGYANWNYKSGEFGLFNEKTRNIELVNIVSGKEE